MKKLLLLVVSATMLWGCGTSKETIERNQQLNDLTSFLKASEINRSSDIKQFKDIVLGLKSDMSKSDEKFTGLMDKNTSYTLEMTEGVKREMDELQSQMGSITSKMKAMSSKLERLARNRYYKKPVRKYTKNIQKPTIKAYVQPKMEPSVKPSIKPAVKPAAKPVVKATPAPRVNKAVKPIVEAAVEPVSKSTEVVVEAPAKTAEPVAAPKTSPKPAVKIAPRPVVKIVTTPDPVEKEDKNVKTDYPTSPGYNEFVAPAKEEVKPIKTKSGKLQIED